MKLESIGPQTRNGDKDHVCGVKILLYWKLKKTKEQDKLRNQSDKYANEDRDGAYFAIEFFLR